MFKIKIRYKSVTIIGELFIIFCTIFYAYGQNGVDFPRSVNSNMNHSGSTDFALQMEELKMKRMAASETKQWIFPMHDKKFSIIVSSNLTNVRWLLYFLNKTQQGKIQSVSSSGGIISFNCTQCKRILNSTQYKRIGYSTDSSRVGMYIVEVTAPENAYVSLFLTKQDYTATTNLINIVDKIERPRHIRVKLDFRNNNCTVEWPQILEKYKEGVDLFIIVSSEKYYKFLPHNSVILRSEGDTEKFFLSRNVTSSKSTIINKLKVEEIYFVTLLAANRVKDGVTCVTYGRTSFKFQKMKPLGLKDGKLVKKSLKRNGGRLSYKYKVSRQRFHNFSGPLIWYVSRCSGKIWVKIKHKKKVIEERLVSKYDVFVIKNVQPDNRYVMKITDASREQNLEFDDVEVLASMRPQLRPFLEAPKSLKVNFTSRRSTSVINWQPLYSNEPVQYCIFTKEINATELTEFSIKNMKIANRCNFNESKNLYNFNDQYCNILYKSSDRRLRSKVRNRNQDLAVQITAEKLSNQVTVVYDLFIIPRRNVN